MSYQCKNCGAKINPGAKFCNQCGMQTHTKREPAPLSSHAYRQVSEKKNAKGLIILISSIGLVLIVVAIMLFRLILPGIKPQNSFVQIKEVTGQPYGNRAIRIHGTGFGFYDAENSRVMIDGKEAGILEWEEDEIFIVVPPGVSGGKKEIKIENPPLFKNTVTQQEFLEHKKVELARAVILPETEMDLEGEGFHFFAPAGSVTKKTEIIISKYDEPSKDDSPYWTVSGEYSITDRKGHHIFFEKQVFFGVDVADAEEAANASFQIFDELSGSWVAAETWFSETNARVYIATTHFSDIRSFFSDMRQGFGRLTDDAARNVSRKITYVTDKLGTAKDWTVELIQDVWVDVKDTANKDNKTYFDSVSDSENRFIIFWRKTDYQKDPSIREKAHLMLAAFVHAYEEYAAIFGVENMPSVTKTKLLSGFFNDPVQVPNPIRVYIDPRYNKSGAVAKSATTGNIIMPSDYQDDDLVSTAAHELFHAVQYKMLGLKQLYMATTTYKDLTDNWLTGNNTQLYRFYANNVWFFDATAEYAARFIATNVGFEAEDPTKTPMIHPRIEANRPYYANNGVHEYGVSSFLDYILTYKNSPDFAKEFRWLAFKEMWDTVTGNYSMASSINVPFERYVYDTIKENADGAYLNFWKDMYTLRDMPDANIIANGKADVLSRFKKSKQNHEMQIMGEAVGIFRYLINPHTASTIQDETSLNSSFWFEVSPDFMHGDVYILSGLSEFDRVEERPLAHPINYANSSLMDALIPYKTGDTCGLVAILNNTTFEDTTAKITLASTELKWDNQEEIEKKVSNTTLRRNDKLKFTPILPKLKAGDPPFTAVVLLNDNYDYLTKIENVKSGKSFEVASPMQDIPPQEVTVNIKIFLGDKLVHEYQSVQGETKATVRISGPEVVRYVLEPDNLKANHSFLAEASPKAGYDFIWVYGDGAPSQKDSGGSSSNVSHEFSGPGDYTTTVTLYNEKGEPVATDTVRIILEMRQDLPPQPTEPETNEDASPADSSHAWVLVDTVIHDAKEDFESVNKRYAGIYENSGAVSPGVFTWTNTYVGNTIDNYAKPPMVHGEGGACEGSYTQPPAVIKGGEELSMTDSLSFTSVNYSYFSLQCKMASQIIRYEKGQPDYSRSPINFEHKDGESLVYIDTSSTNIPFSDKKTVSAVVPKGTEIGEQISIRVSFSTGSFPMYVDYIYQWK